jgi:hypothetical protein
MVIKEHPIWTKWSTAYDALMKAADDLRSVQQLPSSDAVYKEAVRRHKAALDHYNRVSAEID